MLCVTLRSQFGYRQVNIRSARNALGDAAAGDMSHWSSARPLASNVGDWRGSTGPLEPRPARPRTRQRPALVWGGRFLHHRRLAPTDSLSQIGKMPFSRTKPRAVRNTIRIACR